MRCLNIKYETWKLVLDANPSWVIYQHNDGISRELWAGNHDYLYFCEVKEEDRTDYDSWDDNRTVVLVESEDEATARIIGVGEKVIEQARTSDGRIRVTSEKPEGTRINFFSPNLCDKTTWYPKSVRVVDEVAADSGDHLTYTLANPHIIDVYHGKLTFEDDMRDASNNTYRVVVKVDGVTKTEQDPHYGSGGDYTINYINGEIVFLSALDVADEVTVTYHYATTSVFTVGANAGTILQIMLAEAQFSLDVDPKDTVVFEVWGIADYFLSSAQMTALGIPPGIGYKIRLQRNAYKTMGDFYNDTFKSFPLYKAIGNISNWRSQKSDVTVMEWDYISAVPLYGDKGMEVRLSLDHNEPFTGYLATASFYCLSTPV